MGELKLTNQVNNQSLIPSTDLIQLTLTLKMTTAQVIETSLIVNDNNPIHSDDHIRLTYDIIFCSLILMLFTPTPKVKCELVH